MTAATTTVTATGSTTGAILTTIDAKDTTLGVVIGITTDVVAAVVTGAMTVVAADTGVTVVVGAIATTAEDAATIATVHIDESIAVLADLYSPPSNSTWVVCSIHKSQPCMKIAGRKSRL